MKRPDSPPDDLTRLFTRLCDGCIRDEEMDRLNTLLENDEDVRRHYRRWMDLEMELCLATPPREGEGVEPRDASRAPALPPVPSFPWKLWGALAASVVLGLGIFFLQRQDSTEPDSGEIASADPVPEAAKPKAKVLAEIVDMESAKWKTSSGMQYAGLAKGRHELLAGKATLRFSSGATASVKGPATFEVRGEDAYFLVKGMATVFVPSWDAGFRVLAPQVTLSGPGTECGVAVSPDGGTVVGVFRGEAMAQVDSEYLGLTQNIQLTRQEGVMIDKSGAVTSAIIGNNHRFEELRQTPERDVPMVANGSFEFPRARQAGPLAASGWTLLAHPLANADKMPVDAGVVNQELAVVRTPATPGGNQWAYLNAVTFADGRSTFTTMHQEVGDVRAGTTYRLSFIAGMPAKQRGTGGFEASLYAGSIEEGPLSPMKKWKDPVTLRPGESKEVELEYHCPHRTPYSTDQLFIVFGAVPSSTTGIHKVLIDQVDLQIVKPTRKSKP